MTLDPGALSPSQSTQRKESTNRPALTSLTCLEESHSQFFGIKLAKADRRRAMDRWLSSVAEVQYGSQRVRNPEATIGRTQNAPQLTGTHPLESVGGSLDFFLKGSTFQRRTDRPLVKLHQQTVVLERAPTRYVRTGRKKSSEFKLVIPCLSTQTVYPLAQTSYFPGLTP